MLDKQHLDSRLIKIIRDNTEKSVVPRLYPYSSKQNGQKSDLNLNGR